MKVAIIGAGNIGTTLAYTLFVKGLVSEIAIINRTREKAFGEALDMTHALARSRFIPAITVPVPGQK